MFELCGMDCTPVTLSESKQNKFPPQSCETGTWEKPWKKLNPLNFPSPPLLSVCVLLCPPLWVTLYILLEQIALLSQSCQVSTWEKFLTSLLSVSLSVSLIYSFSPFLAVSCCVHYSQLHLTSCWNKLATLSQSCQISTWEKLLSSLLPFSFFLFCLSFSVWTPPSDTPGILLECGQHKWTQLSESCQASTWRKLLPSLFYLKMPLQIRDLSETSLKPRPFPKTCRVPMARILDLLLSSRSGLFDQNLGSHLFFLAADNSGSAYIIRIWFSLNCAGTFALWGLKTLEFCSNAPVLKQNLIRITRGWMHHLFPTRLGGINYCGRTEVHWTAHGY